MPSYDYNCEICGTIEEHVHLMAETPEISCPKCGGKMMKKFSLNSSGFIMKGGTPATHWREKRQRMKRSEVLATKQKATGMTGPRVKPNIAGVETGSWSDARKMAKEAGLNHESYTPWVEKEKKEKKSLII